MSGFFVPGSVSSSYVRGKRDEEGSLQYETSESLIGLQKQAALQSLEKNYASTIENAYASYLAGNRGIASSTMGQGYKDLYKQLQQQQLTQQVSDISSQMSEQKASLAEQEASAKQTLYNQFATEVGYLDKVQQMFADYFEYAKGLTKQNGNTSYLTADEKAHSVDYMYDILYNLQPTDYVDAEGNMGMRYDQYVRSKLKDTSYDNAWYQWFISGGLLEFMNAPKDIEQLVPGASRAAEEKVLAQKAAEEARQKAEQEEKKKTGVLGNIVEQVNPNLNPKTKEKNKGRLTVA